MSGQQIIIYKVPISLSVILVCCDVRLNCDYPTFSMTFKKTIGSPPIASCIVLESFFYFKTLVM